MLAAYSYPIDFIRTHATETPGSLMYIQRSSSEDVHLSLRLSNGKGSAPVELPVVRERYFTTRTLQILGIPIAPASRAMLRVYGVDPDALTTVHIKGFSEDSGVDNTQVFDAVVPLTVVQKYYEPGGTAVPIRPAVAEVNLSALVSGPLAGLRLEIAPVDPTVRLWAFVSVTDNATQAVTLRTPS